MQTDGSHRRLQLMRNRVDKAVMLLVAANLTHEKNCIDDHAGDDQRKKDQAEQQQHAFAPVEDDPANVERNRERHQGDAQTEEENDSSAAACDAHYADSTAIRRLANAKAPTRTAGALQFYLDLKISHRRLRLPAMF